MTKDYIKILHIIKESVKPSFLDDDGELYSPKEWIRDIENAEIQGHSDLELRSTETKSGRTELIYLK